MGSYAQSVHEKMLANLTSLIWGNENTTTTEEEAAVGLKDSSTTKTPNTTTTEKVCSEDPLLDSLGAGNLRASTPSDDEEGDWVLVDRAEVDEACSWEGQVPQWMPETAGTTTRVPVPTSSPVLFAGETSDGPQEWLMTPPPCFTRSQAAPLNSSPLENLLIEHPSMSVYLPRPTYANAAAAGRIFPRRVMSHSSPSTRSPLSVSPSSLPTSGEREESPMREDSSSEVGGGQQVDIPTIGRTGVAQRTASLIQAIDVLRPAQKAQRRREERRLKHKHLDRSNKAREVASAGNKRSKRREMLTPAKFSRVVNNRKC